MTAPVPGGALAATTRIHADLDFVLNAGNHDQARQWAREAHITTDVVAERLHEAITKLQAVAEANSCYFVSRFRDDPCSKGDAAYCDQCGTRWDVEAALDALRGSP